MDFQQAPPRGIIFDLRDVLFKWSAKTTTTISPRTLREIFKTPVWNSHELSSNHFSIPVTMIAEAFAQACKSLKSDRKIVSFLHELKKDSAIQAYAMSNVGKEDFEDLATKMDLLLFDRVFTSAAVGMRKPELGFYNHVLEQICLNGSQVVFVDDKEDNVNAARQLGIRGYVFGESTIHMLSEIFDSPVSKGSRYLFQNAKHCDSITMSGVTFADNFAKLLILDSLQDLILMDLSWGSKETWNFFAGKTVLIPGGLFPDDLDTTYLALTVLRPSSTKTISSLLDTMAEYVNDDGTFQTYFDRNKKRVDPIVSANILACFYHYNRGHEFERTLQLVRSMLLNCSYVRGTRYYSSPDCCLGFIGRLLRSSSDSHLHKTLGPLLKLRIRERLGLDGNALDLAMRIVTCSQLGIECEDDRKALLNLQCEDGSWEAGWMYQYGRDGMKIGNCGVTTAMAVAALSSHDIVGCDQKGVYRPAIVFNLESTGEEHL